MELISFNFHLRVLSIEKYPKILFLRTHVSKEHMEEFSRVFYFFNSSEILVRHLRFLKEINGYVLQWRRLPIWHKLQ